VSPKKKSENGTTSARQSVAIAWLRHVRHFFVIFLSGFFTVVSGFKILFRQEMIKHPLCDMMLKRNEVLMLKEAISQDYFFEFFFDDLPVWG
jgi:hypothetical protein